MDQELTLDGALKPLPHIHMLFLELTAHGLESKLQIFYVLCRYSGCLEALDLASHAKNTRMRAHIKGRKGPGWTPCHLARGRLGRLGCIEGFTLLDELLPQQLGLLLPLTGAVLEMLPRWLRTTKSSGDGAGRGRGFRFGPDRRATQAVSSVSRTHRADSSSFVAGHHSLRCCSPSPRDPARQLRT